MTEDTVNEPVGFILSMVYDDIYYCRMSFWAHKIVVDKVIDSQILDYLTLEYGE